MMTCLHIIIIKGSASDTDRLGALPFAMQNLLYKDFAILGRMQQEIEQETERFVQGKEPILHSFNKTLILDFTHIPYTVISPREKDKNKKKTAK